MLLNSDHGSSSAGSPWVGDQFDHSIEPRPDEIGVNYKKSIIPTRTIFQAGLHMHGGMMPLSSAFVLYELSLCCMNPT